jgi:spore maturation protein CgeB
MICVSLGSQNRMKVLYLYPDYKSESYSVSNKWFESRHIARLLSKGFEIEGFCLTLNPPGPALSWHDLDLLWKSKNRKLLDLYDRILKKMEDCDVILNAAGINLHPDFIEKLDVVTIFQCFDDPENSHNLSMPVAHAYDICLVGNAAEVDRYYSWGAKKAYWHPLGIKPGFYNESLTERQIFSSKRDISTILVADFNYKKRTERLNSLVKLFPTGKYFGPGSRDGYLEMNKFIPYLLRSQIGFNIHNSTGPVNARTYYLPANGVLQICDNKNFLNQAFTINSEIVGADSPQEMVELALYYLENYDEQRKIAHSAYEKVMKSYTEEALFQRILDLSTQLTTSAKSEIPLRESILIRNMYNYNQNYFLLKLRAFYYHFILKKTKIKKTVICIYSFLFRSNA